ncbi:MULTISPECIES: protein-disulfide reductase DsbD [unclassified Neptuniibacter]|uniref:protein-disulfide reductase DsbD n=1 Tax=unclassified Neptuniibacter TaxID=2630693 RepID=UPI000C3BDB5B|nr:MULTISPECIES: protein-disulfide reductase DsbD [unclassified Neptuniibacter]MAY43362.1 protein-disulfide reductase DsbD [Oceanospirillaceae bacterium]
MFDFLKRSTWQHLLFLALFVSVQPATAGLFDKSPYADDGPLQVEEAFVFGQLQDGNRLNLYWDIPDDYYLYRDRIELKGTDKTLISNRVNSPAEQKEDPLFGQVWVYHNRADISYDLASANEDVIDDTLIVTYQGCWEGGICYPPVTKEIKVAGITKNDLSDAPSSSTETLEPIKVYAEGDVAEVNAAGDDSMGTESNESAGPVSLSEQDQFAQMIGQGNLFVILGAFFIAGLALSFTPCVFPMIPILSSIIAGQGRKVTAGKGLFLSVVYVLAVSITYTLAGIFAGLFGENLQALFQNPWIIGSFSFVFVLLSLSMFGFYELQLPNSIQTRLSKASNSQEGGTVAGVAIMGFLSALIVGPCMAAPLAGALIYIGQTGDPVLGGSALFSMSLGMGVPLILVGTSAGKLLPHAGLWMGKVKAVFGVLLLLLAIWMLDRIVPTVVTMWLTALVLIVSAVYMGVLSNADKAKPATHIAKGLGIVVLLYAIALMAGALAGGNSVIYPLKAFAGSGSNASTQKLAFINVTTPEQLQSQLDEAKANNQPVMLDFYADWCVSCIELEVFTFADATVQRSLDRFKVIKVDVTKNDGPAKELNRSYNLIGPPALIFYNAAGEMLSNKTLIGVVGPQDFVNHISSI